MSVAMQQRISVQPQGPVVLERGNPLSQSLVLAVCDSTEAVQNRRVAFDSRVIRGRAAAGRGWQRNSKVGAAPEIFWDSGVVLPSQTAYTVSFVAQATGGGELVSIANNAWVNYATNNYLTYYHYNSTNAQVFAQAYPPFGFMQAPRVLTFGWNGSALRIWIDGVQFQSQATGSLLASTSSIRLYGWPGYFAQHWVGTVSGAFAWSRALSLAEIRAHAANPWQVFRQGRQLFYSIPSLSAAPTLSSPTVINITSTSATPQVFVGFP